MNTNKELEHHIITEFARNNLAPVLLKEEHGYINNIDEVIDYFKTLITPQLNQVFGDDPHFSISNVYEQNINVRTFFKKFKLSVTFEWAKETAYRGGAKPKSVYNDTDTKEWVCVPDINLIIKASNAIKAMKIFSFAIGHELTHCYDLLQYAKETNQDPWYSIDRNRYFDIKDRETWSIINNEKATANILYLMNRMERNAYIAQLKQELMDRKDEMQDSMSAYNLIRKTESYQKFISLENNINAILSVYDKDVQNGLIQYLNSIMNKKFTTYKQVKKYYLNRWLKWKNKYLSTAAKIAHDIYASDNKNTWLDQGMFGNKNTIIKDK